MSVTNRTERDGSLDAFRGLTVLLMMLVNLQGSDETAFWFLKHAAWHGLTLADLVFPWFLLVVGIAIPLTADTRPHPPFRHALVRAAKLFALGIMIGWLLRPTLDPGDVRWAGVLQRIAIVYITCVWIVRRSAGYRLAACCAAALLVLHSALLLGVAAPGTAAPSLLPGQGISGWLDQHVLPGRSHHAGWDPEGVLSTLSAIATGLMGVAVQRWRQGLPSSSPNTLAGIIVGVALVIAGLLLSPHIPLNKSLWTSSYALVAAGLGIILWMVVREIWRRFGRNFVTDMLELLGRSALTAYVLHMVLIAALIRPVIHGKTGWTMGYDWFAASGLSGPWSSLAFSVIALAPVLLAIPMLVSRGWTLKL